MRKPLKTFIEDNGWFIIAVWGAMVIVIGLVGVAVSLRNQRMIDRNYKADHEEVTNK